MPLFALREFFVYELKTIFFFFQKEYSKTSLRTLIEIYHAFHKLPFKSCIKFYLAVTSMENNNEKNYFFGRELSGKGGRDQILALVNMRV